MKTEEARRRIAEILIEKKTTTAQEINYAAKNAIPPIQIYTTLTAMVKCGAIELHESDGAKSYTLVDESKLLGTPAEKDHSKEGTKVDSKTRAFTRPSENRKAEVDEEEGEEDEPSKDKFVKSGRDLTKYKFNGQEYNKGRLALAIVTQYAKDKKPTYKAALLIFADDLVPPYGMIKSIKEAKQISKERARFFIKPEEEVKLKDEVIAVSNQWTKERIDKLISIAKKQLGYTIK